MAINRSSYVLSGDGEGDPELRKARMRAALADVYDDLNQAKRDLAKRRAELDAVRTKWTALQYRLRAFEVVTKLLGPSQEQQ
jgi:hypothetical protein